MGMGGRESFGSLSQRREEYPGELGQLSGRVAVYIDGICGGWGKAVLGLGIWERRLETR